MSLLPVSTLNAIKTSLVELGLMDSKAKENPAMDERIQSHSVLLFRVIRDIEKIPAEEIYRVVEFGCGDNSLMFCMVKAVTHFKHKKLMYVGIA
jgi:hypothetical protein